MSKVSPCLLMKPGEPYLRNTWLYTAQSSFSHKEMLECSSKVGSRKLPGPNAERRGPTLRVSTRCHSCSQVRLARRKLRVGNVLNTAEPRTPGAGRTGQQGAGARPVPLQPESRAVPGVPRRMHKPGSNPGQRHPADADLRDPGPQPSVGGRGESK